MTLSTCPKCRSHGPAAGRVSKCDTGLTIEDTDGVRWIYCRAHNLDVTLGEQVAAGQQIMLSGDTGYSGGPHLHLGIRVNSVDVCPQPLSAALRNDTSPPTLDELRTYGCAA